MHAELERTGSTCMRFYLKLTFFSPLALAAATACCIHEEKLRYTESVFLESNSGGFSCPPTGNENEATCGARHAPPQERSARLLKS
jgi:hypothetical protein